MDNVPFNQKINTPLKYKWKVLVQKYSVHEHIIFVRCYIKFFWMLLFAGVIAGVSCSLFPAHVFEQNRSLHL